MSTCAICCETICEHEKESCVLSWPGCGHRFHTACALNSAQYNITCPLCRRQNDDMPQRQISIVDCLRTIDPGLADATLAIDTGEPQLQRIVVRAIDEDQQVESTPTLSTIDIGSLSTLREFYENRARTVARNNYMARRRRLLRRTPSLMALDLTVRNEYRLLVDKTNEINRAWAEVLRVAWREDAGICKLRDEYTRVRTRLARHRRSLRLRLEEVLGEEPEL